MYDIAGSSCFDPRSERPRSMICLSTPPRDRHAAVPCSYLPHTDEQPMPKGAAASSSNRPGTIQTRT
jgi:hypothetical protein